MRSRKATKYANTKDNFRVDVGLIIHRHPIFYTISDTDMRLLKLKSYF
jgi:hypothetical protein